MKDVEQFKYFYRGQAWCVRIKYSPGTQESEDCFGL
jgi:hypothetical protein